MTPTRTLMLELIGHPIILYCMIPKKNVSRALKDQMALKTDGTQQQNVRIKKDLTQLNFTFLLEQQLFFVLRKQQSILVLITFRNIQTLLQAAVLFLRLCSNQQHLLFRLLSKEKPSTHSNKRNLFHHHKKSIYKNKSQRKKKKLKRKKGKEIKKGKKKLK